MIIEYLEKNEWKIKEGTMEVRKNLPWKKNCRKQKLRIGDFVFVTDPGTSFGRAVYKYRKDDMDELMEGDEKQKCDIFLRFIEIGRAHV